MKIKNDAPTKYWQMFEAGRSIEALRGMRTNSQAAYNFYEGDQWKGLPVKNAYKLPVLNFIKPSINYKLNMTCLNEMKVNITGKDAKVCEYLTETINQKLDEMRMDKAKWEIVREGLISGSGYILFPDGRIMQEGYKCSRRDTVMQFIDSNNIFFGDEKEKDVQKQPYILIMERRHVEEVKEIARRNRVDETEIRNIVSDDDHIYEEVTTDVQEEVKSDNPKCTCLIYMTIKDGTLHIARSTKQCVFVPETPVIGQNSQIGMTAYPIISYIVNPKKGSARGRGEVLSMIPNQIEYNANLVRMAEAVKNTAYPKTVYDKDSIDNIEEIASVGGMIAVSGNAQKVTDAIGYLPPSKISSDALNLNALLCDKTRELHNAGSAVMGDVDPTKTSGTAIITLRDQANVPLNEIQAEYKKMFEDCALVLYRYLVAHNPDGVHTQGSFSEDEGEVITQQQLDAVDARFRIDVSSIQPDSIYGREQALEALLAKNLITFEEYVNALPDNCVAPKTELLEILQKRAELEKVQQVQDTINNTMDQQDEESLLAEMAENQINGSLPKQEQPDVIPLEGGETNGQT